MLLLPSHCWGNSGDLLDKDCIAMHMGKDTLYLLTIQMPLWASKLENGTVLDKIDTGIRYSWKRCTLEWSCSIAEVLLRWMV